MTLDSLNVPHLEGIDITAFCDVLAEVLYRTPGVPQAGNSEWGLQGEIRREFHQGYNNHLIQIYAYLDFILETMNQVSNSQGTGDTEGSNILASQTVQIQRFRPHLKGLYARLNEINNTTSV